MTLGRKEGGQTLERPGIRSMLSGGKKGHRLCFVQDPSKQFHHKTVGKWANGQMGKPSVTGPLQRILLVTVISHG